VEIWLINRSSGLAPVVMSRCVRSTAFHTKLKVSASPEEATVHTMEREIEERVYWLYGLVVDEIEIVEKTAK